MKSLFTFLGSLIFICGWSQVETLFTQDFEDDVSSWFIDDLDDDGYTWEIVLSSSEAQEQGWGPNGTSMVGSFAYNLLPGEEGPLYPDNLLISPSITLSPDSNLNLSFLLGTNVDYMNNHNFQLYIVSNYSVFDQTWIPVFEKNFSGIDTAQEVNLDISDYAGQEIQLVFRHFDSDEQFVLLLDDILITKSDLKVQDLEIGSKLKIYPNPTQDYLHIKNNKNVDLVEIYAMNGQLINAFRSTKIDVRNLPKGMYIVKVKSGSETFSKRFIKN